MTIENWKEETGRKSDRERSEVEEREKWERSWPNTQSINYAATKYTNQRTGKRGQKQHEPRKLQAPHPLAPLCHCCRCCWCCCGLSVCGGRLFGWSRGKQTSCDGSCETKAMPRRDAMRSKLGAQTDVVCGFLCVRPLPATAAAVSHFKNCHC